MLSINKLLFTPYVKIRIASKQKYRHLQDYITLQTAMLTL